jgi:hypothetical protein
MGSPTVPQPCSHIGDFYTQNGVSRYHANAINLMKYSAIGGRGGWLVMASGAPRFVGMTDKKMGSLHD